MIFTSKSINQSLAEMRAALQEMRELLNKQDHRINMANQRTAQVEHYTGMRKHRFKPNDDVWQFNQIRQDIKQDIVPRSLFHTGQNRKRKAA